MKRSVTRRLAKAGAFLVCGTSLIATGYFAGKGAFADDFGVTPRAMPFDDVLDGDTIIDKGRAVRIRDLDAPELGPWATCWAEAALAGMVKGKLEMILLENRGWRLVSVRQEKGVLFSGMIVDRDGFSIADDMRVYGGSAMTTERWNWCVADPRMRSPLEGERPPIGPNIWWPTGDKFDPRAND